MTTASIKENFHRVPNAMPIEEELLPGYKAEDFYPAAIDETLKSRYRVVCKLGCGVGSTVWLATDVKTSRYRAVKVCTRTTDGAVPAQASQEIAVAEFLSTAAPVQEHPGRRGVRTALDAFTVTGPHGTHTCLVYAPQGMTFTELRDYLPVNRLPKRMLQTSIQLLRWIIFTKMALSTQRGLVRRLFTGDIMPDVYRAPEVILGMEWSSKVDLWSVGVMIWDLLEGKRLFHAKKDGVLGDERHLAEMVSLIGNPPPEFLRRSKICARFFDDAGNWKGSIPIPDQSFEDRITQVQGEDKELLLRFVRSVLCWLPEQRPTAEEMAYDDFLMQAYFAANSKS
ncbi:Dual specificity tyrosine-phosphorylation-regulated kinase-like protein [Hapsidospora chrysogenum ATCC 11550]|uniref:non-specific serine/threonine protein kinase n=1 Tax=Hapsidospora chrysogenum (strain ATCC 11550 / CBS 779.69 / DSM 880 / IAM 14645 / JCM 23072 / IMI 49137) TaxID=857340 RepID=A0A086SX98_HAPC1|nr:Dual specificity tyrosine-phosphorylation-regulated kinase-like protein [Hapsidospora chrysogenum ATCC 11550]